MSSDFRNNPDVSEIDVGCSFKGTLPSQAKPLGLEQIKRAQCAVKVSRLNVPLILYRFYQVTFLDTVTDSCFAN